MTGADVLAQRVVAADIPGAYNGKGRVVLFATNPIYRWQNHGEFNMVFNAMLNWAYVPPAAASAPALSPAAAPAPARAPAPAQPPALPGSMDLADRLDCLREGQLALVAAHRGQPDQTAAENALSSFRASIAAGVPFLEIDVATTKDGILTLMHDDTLDRTTTGSGRVDAHTWAELQAVRIKRPDGTVLDDRLPTFAEALEWGREAHAYFEVDVKPTTKFSDIVTAVQAARMADRVVIVTYKLADAVTIHGLDARLMISVTLDTPEALAEARTVIDPHRMLGWTGTRDPQKQPFAALRAAGIEPIFGTLGRPGERLDDTYLADGNGSEYVDLVRAGAVMIASDAAAAAQRAIGAGYRACFSK
jgi:glycerophosphoryl diester phosphodiesterase